jgi:hypothetical protein
MAGQLFKIAFHSLCAGLPDYFEVQYPLSSPALLSTLQFAGYAARHDKY